MNDGMNEQTKVMGCIVKLVEASPYLKVTTIAPT